MLLWLQPWFMGRLSSPGAGSTTMVMGSSGGEYADHMGVIPDSGGGGGCNNDNNGKEEVVEEDDDDKPSQRWGAAAGKEGQRWQGG